MYEKEKADLYPHIRHDYAQTNYFSLPVKYFDNK